MTDPAIPDLPPDAAARAAVALVEPGMRLGLGTGSTAAIFVRRLAQRVRDEGFALRCAATSKATAELAVSLGLAIEELNAIGWLDLTIDGADEVDPDLNLIKGGGGAHLREKIVACASDRMVVIADASKVVTTLGSFALPIEVNRFGVKSTLAAIVKVAGELGLSGDVKLRMTGDESFVTDGGHLIADASFGRIPDPKALASALCTVPGVVEHGLFLGLADIAVIASQAGIDTITANSH